MSEFSKDSFRTVGLIGTILFGTLLLTCIWRTYDGWLKTVDYTNKKFVFHVALLFFALLETIYCIGFLVYDGFTFWGYCLHLIALFANVAAFASVIRLWGDALAFGGKYEHSKRAAKVLIAINCIITIICVIALCISNSVSQYQDDFNGINLAHVLIHSLSLLSLSLWMTAYGIRLQRKLTAHSMWGPAEKKKRLGILLRLNSVLFTCTLCYSLRVFALGILSYDLASDSVKTGKFNNFGWFFLSQWIPTIIPSYVLLYIMRIQGERPSTIVLQQQLSPVDEEEYPKHDNADDVATDSSKRAPRAKGFSTDSVDIAFSPTASPLNHGTSSSDTSRDFNGNNYFNGSRHFSADNEFSRASLELGSDDGKY